MAELAVDVAALVPHAERLAAAGKTPVYAAVAGRPAGLLAVAVLPLLAGLLLGTGTEGVGPDWLGAINMALLLAAGIALAGAPVMLIAGKIALGWSVFRRLDWWATSCLLVTPLIYGASAMSASLNLGLRHILPVYPYIFIGIAVVMAMVIARWRIRFHVGLSWKQRFTLPIASQNASAL